MYLYDLFPEYKVENQEFECKRTIAKSIDNEEQRLNWMTCTIGNFLPIVHPIITLRAFYCRQFLLVCLLRD